MLAGSLKLPGLRPLKVQGQVRDAIWFGRSEPLPSQVDMAYRISVNEYQGRQSVQMIVEAIADAA